MSLQFAISPRRSRRASHPSFCSNPTLPTTKKGEFRSQLLPSSPGMRVGMEKKPSDKFRIFARLLRQRHNELAATVVPRAKCAHAAAMQLDELMHESQADAEPAVGSIFRV